MESIINELRQRTQAAIDEKEKIFNACVDEAFDNAVEECRKAADKGKNGAVIHCSLDTNFIQRLTSKLQAEGIRCTALRPCRLHGGLNTTVHIFLSWEEC